MQNEEIKNLSAAMKARGYASRGVDEGQTLTQHASCGQRYDVLLSRDTVYFSGAGHEFYADPVTGFIYVREQTSSFWHLDVHALIMHEWVGFKFANFMREIDQHCSVLAMPLDSHPKPPTREEIVTGGIFAKAGGITYQRVVHGILNVLRIL